MGEQNGIYEILFEDFYSYFHNLDIILSVLDNFKDEIINFVIKIMSFTIKKLCLYCLKKNERN